MRSIKKALLFLYLFLGVVSTASAKETSSERSGGVFFTSEELGVIRQLALEKQCLITEKPVVTLDPVTIVTDKEGRVYYSGDKPRPYTVKLDWCNYQVEAKGKLNVTVLRDTPPNAGFRFRLKFYGAFLFLDAVERPSAAEGADLGLQLDFLYWRNLNLNVNVGFRSVGASVGYDLTRNFGVFGGASLSFWTLRPNPVVGLYFSFW